MFYEAKVTEDSALVVDAWKAQSKRQGRTLSAADLAGLQNVVSYIADHYAFDLPLKRLANIACMSESKLKTCFKQHFGCTTSSRFAELFKKSTGILPTEYRKLARKK